MEQLEFNFNEAPAGQPIEETVIKCECGKDKVGDAGLHSDWCPKYKESL